ncbi:MAG: hypothetical protein ABI145_12525 [Steroidobacteraceae bacterium]
MGIDDEVRALKLPLQLPPTESVIGAWTGSEMCGDQWTALAGTIDNEVCQVPISFGAA